MFLSISDIAISKMKKPVIAVLLPELETMRL